MFLPYDTNVSEDCRGYTAIFFVCLFFWKHPMDMWCDMMASKVFSASFNTLICVKTHGAHGEHLPYAQFV